MKVVLAPQTYVISAKRKVFFTSDTHFFHKNIIKYNNRPFGSIMLMNDALIENWNSVVGKDDEVFHLGDFAFSSLEEAKYILSRLNGKLNLCLGNHDKIILKHLDELSPYLESISTSREITVILDGVKYTVFLNHYAQLVWNKAHHGSLHFWGHSHGGIASHTQGCDVGVDNTEFKYAPQSFSTLLAYVKAQKNEYPSCYGKALKKDHHFNEE